MPLAPEVTCFFYRCPLLSLFELSTLHSLFAAAACVAAACGCMHVCLRTNARTCHAAVRACLRAMLACMRLLRAAAACVHACGCVLLVRACAVRECGCCVWLLHACVPCCVRACTAACGCCVRACDSPVAAAVLRAVRSCVVCVVLGYISTRRDGGLHLAVFRLRSVHVFPSLFFLSFVDSLNPIRSDPVMRTPYHGPILKAAPRQGLLPSSWCCVCV